MKKVELYLTCTYTVGITMTVPDEVCKSMEKRYYDNDGAVDLEAEPDNKDVGIVSDYLANHISEKDSDGGGWYNIDDFDVIQDENDETDKDIKDSTSE